MFKASSYYHPEQHGVMVDFRIDYVRVTPHDLVVSLQSDVDPSEPVTHDTEHITGHWMFMLTAESVHNGTYVDILQAYLAGAWEQAHGDAPENSVVSKMTKFVLGIINEKAVPGSKLPGKKTAKAINLGGVVSGGTATTLKPGETLLPTPSTSVGNSSFNPVQNLSRACPALNAMVTYPKGTAREGQISQLYLVIQTLNDNDKWTREQIADWLETLDLDIGVQIEE